MLLSLLNPQFLGNVDKNIKSLNDFIVVHNVIYLCATHLPILRGSIIDGQLQFSPLGPSLDHQDNEQPPKKAIPILCLCVIYSSSFEPSIHSLMQ